VNSKPVALVTGGSRGIGRAICVELARSDYNVVINFNENFSAAEATRGLVEELGAVGEMCQADITSKSDRELLVEFSMEHFGRLDLLVNNAGIAPPVRQDVLETTEESFDRIMNGNLRAPYFLTQNVSRQMIELINAKTIEHGMIVNISSLRSYTAARNYGEYCISKAGVSMMTKLFAVRLAEHGINVYEVCPGIIETDMTSGEATREYYNTRMAKGMAPINRWGKPQEVALAVSAIAKGHFPFSTGAVFNVDGGWHLRHL
jgi:NAD(P)-dependent dehydrogenase (short-subunit alcohol dehydrogenase family)